MTEPDDRPETPEEQRSHQLRSDFACTLWRLIIHYENERLDRSVIRDVLSFVADKSDEDWRSAKISVAARSGDTIS